MALWEVFSKLVNNPVRVEAIYVRVPADNLTDSALATIIAHLDTTTVLSRQGAERGIYSTVDPLDSTFRIIDYNVIGAQHYNRS